MLHMMYDVKNSHPDHELLDTRGKGIVLRSSSNVNFIEKKLPPERYMKSP